MAKYTEAQKKCMERYLKDKASIRLVVPQEKADKYKAKAEAEGKSLTKYIMDKLDEDD